MIDFEKYRGKMPDLLLEALQRYVMEHCHTGSFLHSVLTNNLLMAVSHGDDDSLASLREIIRLLVNEVPSECWGTESKVKEWLKPK